MFLTSSLVYSSMLSLLVYSSVLFQLDLTSLYQSFISAVYSPVNAFVQQYGYYAIFLILLLEAASLPIPSEIVLPIVGFLSYSGRLNVFLAFLAVILGSAVGMGIDYYVAYFLGKKVVYKRVKLLGLKKEHLRAFVSWFGEHGRFTVFIARLLPIIRGFVSFPAGFARMPLGQFYTFSLLGAAIWDILLIVFGYYAVPLQNVNLITVMASGFAIMIYFSYRFVVVKIEEGR